MKGVETLSAGETIQHEVAPEVYFPPVQGRLFPLEAESENRREPEIQEVRNLGHVQLRFEF